eukprot:symbB.v1.2.012833.t1/scaffold893.1/size154614/14
MTFHSKMAMKAGRSVSLNGRTYTAEDLEQAERRCRAKFGLPASGGERRLAPDRRRRDATKVDPPVEVKSEVPQEAPEAETPAPEAAPPAAVEPEIRKNTQSLSEFLADRILGRCNSMASAEKFFEWLREQAQAGEYIKGYRGRRCTLEDVEAAERRCKEEWARQESQQVDSDQAGNSSSSSSSSDSAGEDEKDQKKQEASERTPGGVDDLVEYVKRKTDNQAKIEKYFQDRFEKIDKKVRAVGRVMSHSEITEAMACYGCGQNILSSVFLRTRWSEDTSKIARRCGEKHIWK